MKDMQNNNEKKYWKSIDQLENEARFNEMAEAEFQTSPLKSEDGNDGLARRDFLKLMGASVAMSATACVRRPAQKIVPYAKRPEDLVVGKPNFYASVLADELSGAGLIVRTREGRPIKLEPNPANPASPKGISTRMQAHCISLYDPERLKQPKRWITEENFHDRKWNLLTWEKIDDEVIGLLEKENVTLITNNYSSPSRKALIDDFMAAFKGSKSFVWNPLVDSAEASAQERSYGKEVSVRPLFEKAKYIVTVGADFLGEDPRAHEYATAYAKTRNPDGEMSRLVTFEAMLSLTGMNADDRIRVKPSQFIDVLMGLAHEIVVTQGNGTVNSSTKSKLAEFAGVAKKLNIDEALFSEVAKDLWKNRGQSLVLTGGTYAGVENAEDLYVAANFLNTILGNDGKTIDYAKNNYTTVNAKQSDLEAFLAELKTAKNKVLIVENLNLVYYGGETVKKAIRDFQDAGGTFIYMGLYQDETGDMADILLPIDHSLEAWGDAEFHKGVYGIQQPTIRPLHNSRSLEQSMLNWAYALQAGSKRLQGSETYYDYVRSYWKSDILNNSKNGQAFEDFWFELLQKGVYGELAENVNLPVRSFKQAALASISAAKSEGMELSLYTKAGIGDGKYANIAWLQEFPDPISKVTWDNYATFSKATADKMGIKEGSVVTLDVEGQKVEVPAYVQVGQHDSVIGLALGYGRTKGGRVANGVGVDAYPLVKRVNSKAVFAGRKVVAAKTEKFSPLANTQGHNTMMGRQIIVEATLDSYKKDKSAGIHKHKFLESAWGKHEYKGYRWGMAVDLNSCFGCGSCVVACQAENNIPVVGKKYVLEGREMHWMRIDRYYSGDMNNPDSHVMPVMCQHCENAPCETVCPVLATVHDDEGTNSMVYNRCVGTRYCSNNCPYKVRRFNWFALTKGDRPEDTPREAYNPRVTVRSRGVMEKCTFCIQRIHDVKDTAKNENRTVRDGEIKVACEEGCPSGAITFGNMNDPESRVSKLFESQRTYKLLEEYLAVPSVRYQTKIRNAKRENTDHHGEGSH